MNDYDMMRRGIRGAMYRWVLRAGPALLLLVALFFVPASAWASTLPSATSGLTMQVNAGFQTRYRGWIPVHVALSNTGADFNGTLSINISSLVPPYGRSLISPSGYQEPIHLPRGIQQQVSMYIPLLIDPSVFGQFGPPSLVINLLDRRGNVIRTQTRTPIPLGPSDVFVGLLSDEPSGFGPLRAVSLPNPGSSLIVEPLDANTLPDMTPVLANFDMIVLDDFTTKRLSPGQLTALQVWVNRGGRLLVVGGLHWQRTLSALPPGLLPVVVNGTRTLPADTRLLPISDPEAGNVGQQTVSDTLQEPITVSTTTTSGQGDAGSQLGGVNGPCSSPAGETLLASGSIPLIVQAARAQGCLYYLAFDPTQPAFTRWAGTRILWKQLLLRALGDPLLLSGSTPRYNSDIEQLALSARMVALLQPDAPAGLWMLVLLLLSYSVVLGPGSLLVARRLKRPHWRWRIVVSSMVIFSLCSYGLAFFENRASFLDKSIALMQVSQDGSSAYIRTYARVLVPDQGDYQVHLPGKGLAQLIPNDLYQQDADASNEEHALAILLQPHETTVNLLGASMWSSHAILWEQDRPVHGGIVSHLVLRDGTLTGTMTNTLSSALGDGYVLLPKSFARIGPLAAGQTLRVNLPLSRATSTADMPLADQLAKASGLPIPYLPDVHASPPQTALQRHMAILALLSGEAFNFSPCRTCGIPTINHTLVAPFATGMTISPANSNDPLLLAGAPATFIGWAEQSLDTSSDMTINGFKPGGLHETLVQAPLTLQISSP